MKSAAVNIWVYGFDEHNIYNVLSTYLGAEWLGHRACVMLWYNLFLKLCQDFTDCPRKLELNALKSIVFSKHILLYFI